MLRCGGAENRRENLLGYADQAPLKRAAGFVIPRRDADRLSHDALFLSLVQQFRYAALGFGTVRSLDEDRVPV